MSAPSSPHSSTVAASASLAPVPANSDAEAVAAAAAKAAAAAAAHAEPPFLVHFAAGTFGGIFGLTLCYPLDTVKVRHEHEREGRTSTALPPPSPLLAPAGRHFIQRPNSRTVLSDWDRGGQQQSASGKHCNPLADCCRHRSFAAAAALSSSLSLCSSLRFAFRLVPPAPTAVSPIACLHLCVRRARRRCTAA